MGRLGKATCTVNSARKEINVPLHKRRKEFYCPNIYTVLTTKRPINNNRTCSTDCQLAGWSCSKIFYRKWKRQILSPFYPGVAFVEVLLQQLQPMLTTPRHKRWLQQRSSSIFSQDFIALYFYSYSQAIYNSLKQQKIPKPSPLVT